MMKLKTNKAAKKRFKITAKGKVIFKGVGRRHNLLKKQKNKKRALLLYSQLPTTQAKKIKSLIHS